MFLDIVLGAGVGQIDGRVIDAQLRPVSGVPAVLIPDRNRGRFDLYRSVSTDENGRFVFPSVAPGDYRLFSWSSLEPYGYFEPEVVRLAEPKARPVTVGEGSRQSVEITVIP